MSTSTPSDQDQSPETEDRPVDEPEPFFPDWDDTSDEDVQRDTYGESRLRELERTLR